MNVDYKIRKYIAESIEVLNAVSLEDNKNKNHILNIINMGNDIAKQLGYLEDKQEPGKLKQLKLDL